MCLGGARRRGSRTARTRYGGRFTVCGRVRWLVCRPSGCGVRRSCAGRRRGAASAYLAPVHSTCRAIAPAALSLASKQNKDLKTIFTLFTPF